MDNISLWTLCTVCLLLLTQYIASSEDSANVDRDENRVTHLDLKEGAIMGNYEAGQTQVMNIQRDSQHPRYGRCWINALAAVSAGCKRLTDDEQSRMALLLANCHLAKADFPTFPCDETMSIRDCLNPMKGDSIAFNAYTEFFTHTQDICFFLQSQVWHQQTEETVDKLARSSEDVAEQLEETGRLQETMMEQQNQSLRNQQQILAQEAQLRDALRSSTDSIQEVFSEMKSSTLEQKALFAETFDRVAQVQKLMLGEFTWFNSVIYYVVVLLLVYMVTATPRTAGARFALFMLLMVNWVVESLLFRVMDSNDQTLFHARTWAVRKVFCSLGILILLYSACRYRDYHQINHRILLQIQTQLQQGLLQASSSSSPPSLLPGAALHGALQSASAAALSIASPAPVPAIKSTPMVPKAGLDVTGFSSDSDVDVTYRPENLASSASQDSSSSEHSFLTAEPASRKTSITDKFFSRTPNSGDKPSTSQGDPGSSAKRKRGRPKGSKNNTPRDRTPLSYMGFQSPYNLRQRGPHQSPNPIIDLETTFMFAQQVESLANRHYVVERRGESPSSSSARQRGRSSHSKPAGGPAFFSSDEEA